MNTLRWVDGSPVDAGAASPVGWERGVGLFETMAVAAGRVRLLERHLARLSSGCARLGLSLPPQEQLRTELEAAAALPGVGVLKLVVVQGRPGSDAPDGSTRCLQATGPRHRPAEWWRSGVRVHVCRLRLGPAPALAGLKHLGRLELHLARAEWRDPEIAEGLLADVHGRIVCGTMTNVFAVVDSQLVTPDLMQGGVAGVMRAELLEAWRDAGVDVAVRELHEQDLERATEVFLTNALIGAWPVRQLGLRLLSPGARVREAQAFGARCSA
jgi:4-amino-4-deoxychorismate lyase